jgi:hypothetical protein
MKLGRPTKYDEKLADKICEMIATSNKSLASICQAEGMPSRTTIYNWLKDNQLFLNKYTRAKEDQADFLAEEMIKIADEEMKTEVETEGEYLTVTRQDNVQRSRLMIETRKWLAMKLKPKKYGEKLDVEVQSKIIKVEVEE